MLTPQQVMDCWWQTLDRLKATGSVGTNEEVFATFTALLNELIEGTLELPAKAHARNTDPSTSHAAAKSVDHIRQSQMAILDILQSEGPLTDSEIYEWIVRLGWKMSTSGARTRRAELVAMNKVYDTGQRRKLKSGRMSIVWAAL